MIYQQEYHRPFSHDSQQMSPEIAKYPLGSKIVLSSEPLP